MIDRYNTLCEKQDWEELPTNTVKGDEAEFGACGHTLNAWRSLVVDGENASHIYVKMIMTFPNIKPEKLFDLIS